MTETMICEVTSADLAATLQILHKENIIIADVVQTGDLTIRFLTERGNVDQLNAVLSRQGARVRLIRRLGLSHRLHPWLRHRILIVTIFLLLAMTVFLPKRILFIRVEGNRSIPTNRILEVAEDAGVRFGAVRKDLRSEKVKNTLLEKMPSLQWVGVNTSGCVATVSVRESSVSDTMVGYPISEIVAVRDGVVRSCIVKKGTALCGPGQSVRAGEVLVSGYTDCGRAILVTGVEAEIFAETTRHLETVMLDKGYARASEKSQIRKISLLIGKKRINFYNDSGILDATCVKMYSEYYITLPGGFCLPLGLSVETVTEWDVSDSHVDNAAEIMADYTRHYLTGHMSAGEILDGQVRLSDGRLYSDYICLEMIGQNRYEEIVGEHGKIDGKNG